MSSMIVMSWISVMVSSSILVLISGIMNGFEYETIASLAGLHAHATIEAERDQLNVPSLTAFLSTNVKEVEYWAPQTVRYGCVYTKDSTVKPIVTSLLFIDPVREKSVRSLEKYVRSKMSLENVLTADAVVIGQALADHMNIGVGDELTILIANSSMNDEQMFSYEKQQVVIGGIVKTGLDDIDMYTVFCSYEMYAKVYGECLVERLNIKFHELVDTQMGIEKIKDLTGLTVYSWQEHYPALLDALKLEKRVASLVTFLIVIMAMISIIALLFMFVQSKKADIALFLVLGASTSVVRSVFVIIGFLVISSAALVGILTAAIAGYVINRFVLFPLPDAYFVSQVTVIFDFGMLLFWYCAILFIGFFAMLIPLKTVSDKSIHNTIRFER